MKIIFFAYREWAIEIYKKIIHHYNNKIEFLLISNKLSVDIDIIDSINPEIILFYGWSWMIEDKIIKKYRCICLHPSLLPKYRGGSPIQNQIINGENESGVTLFEMTQDLDGGPIIFQKQFSLDGSLFDILDRVIKLGTIGTIELIENISNLELKEQDNDNSTEYKRRKPHESEIKPDDFLKHEAEYFYNFVRALQNPYPLPFIKCKNNSILYLMEVKYE